MFRFGKLIVIALAGLMAVGCQATQSVRNAPLPPPSADAPLTVLTYNIRVGYGSSNPGTSPYGLAWGRNLGAVVDAIRSVNPDVVGLQEVAGESQARTIANALGMHYVFAWHGNIRSPWWGVAVLSKHPIVRSRSFQINDYGTGSREAVAATISLDGVELDVLNLHRVTDKRSPDGVVEILDATEQLQNPVILIGDFNISPVDSRLDDVRIDFNDSATMANSSNAELARGRGTFLNALVRIDYVFVEKGCYAVIDAGLMNERHWLASDHIGYYAKLDWTASGTKVDCRPKAETPQTASKRIAAVESKVANAWRHRLSQAMCGDPEEQYWLGVMHKAGTEPAAQDAVAAYKWVSLAAKAGHRLAARSKPKYAQDLTPPQREAVDKETHAWQPIPCRRSSPKA